MSNTSYTFKENSYMKDIQGGDKKVMKKILSVALSTAMAFSMFASVAFGAESQTPQQQFDALKAKGILAGYPDGSAHLEKTITRAELAKVIVKTLGLKEVTGVFSYKDKNYNAKNWAAPYIEAVSAAGIMQGKDTAKKIFDFNGNVTAEELATVLVRALKLEVPTTGIDNSATKWAQGYVQAAINAGLIDKSTNFQAAATRSQVVVAAYVVDQKVNITVSSAKVVDANNVEFTLSNGEVVKVKLDKALVANQETTVDFADSKGNKFSYKVTYVVTSPAVESVTSLNGGQLLVKFNKAVDSTTASAVGNYTLSDGKAISTAAVQADGKSVLLTLASAYDNKAHQVAVTVQNVKVDGTVDTTFPIFTSILTVNDNVAPTITSVNAVSNTDKVTSVTVNFSEPISTGAAFKVDGVGANAPYTGGVTSVTVTIPNGLAVGTSHKVEVVNVTDLSGNVNAIASLDFTPVKDVVAPAVSSVQAQGDNALLVTFSKDMKKDAAALANLKANIKVKNDVYNDVAVTNVKAADNSTKTQFVVELDPTAAAGLFSSTKTSHNLTVLFVDNTIEDYVGNKVVGTSKTVTLVKDVVAPAITGVTYKTNSAGKVTSVVVNFNKGLQAGTLSFPTNMVNENGVLVNTSSVLPGLNNATVANGATSAEFTLAVPQTVVGKYSVNFAPGFAKDASLAHNDSVGYQAVIDFGATQVAGDFTVTSATSANNVITVTFPEAVKGGAVAGSATDASRYTINGKALPAGTTITLNATGTAQTVATITLPAGTVDTSDNTAIFTVNGVQTLTGKTNKAFTQTLTIVDNVKPNLVSAQLMADGQTIVLTYNENIVAQNDLSGAFNIYVDNTKLTLNANDLTKLSASGKQIIAKYVATTTTTTAPASFAKSGPSATKVTLSGTATADSTKTYTVVDNAGTLEVRDGATLVTTLDASGNGNFNQSGVTVTVAGGADTDTFTVTTTKAVTSTTNNTLDTNKTVSIETVAPANDAANFAVEDTAGNDQKSSVKVTTTR